jgi:hypothetical protein
MAAATRPVVELLGPGSTRRVPSGRGRPAGTPSRRTPFDNRGGQHARRAWERGYGPTDQGSGYPGCPLDVVKQLPYPSDAGVASSAWARGLLPCGRWYPYRYVVAGLLLPAECNKLLTALAKAEPVVGAWAPAA